jgi:hypothetical protein
MPSTWSRPGASSSNALLELLSSLVSKPVRINLSVNDEGPVATVHGRLLRVETTEEGGGVAYLRFNDEGGDARVVLPLAGLRSCAPDTTDPQRALLDYGKTEVEICGTSAEACVWRYERLAAVVLARPVTMERARECNSLAARVRAEIPRVDDPLIGLRLEQIASALLVASVVGDDDIPF